ncbi:MAG: site-2 protease family protein [Clostridia bacterium]|nr:site-2 protease family protein [Clostridia bacterium]
MAKLKFKLHPLFILFGIYFAFTGKVFSFIVYTLTAVIHELGHYYASEKHGYALNKIVLMPYGALIVGNADGLRYKDECKIALAGPLLNGVISVFFVALWWLFPVTYPFTEEIVIANASLALINLLPCYPLDGGRFLLATLSLKLDRRRARKIVRALGVILSFVLLALFIYSIFTSVNYTILFFALFTLVGALFNGRDGEYVKIFESFTFKPITSPLEVKEIAVGEGSLVKSIYPLITSDYYYELKILSQGKVVLLSGEKLYKFLASQSGYDTFYSALKKFTENP